MKIGDTFFVSSVEVLESTVRNGAATDALYDFTIDRSQGAGAGRGRGSIEIDGVGRIRR